MLTRDFSPKAGGAEHYAMSLVEGLSSRHEVHVFAQTIEHHWPNVHYHRISKPFTRPRFVNQWWYAWQTWVATQSGFDIVHAHENTWHGEVQTVHVLPVWIHYFALKKSSAPWWVSLSRPSVRAAVSHCFKWLGVLLSPRLMSYLWLEHARLDVGPHHPHRHITSVSASLTEQLLGHFPIGTERLHTLMPGVSGAFAWWQQEQRKEQERSCPTPEIIAWSEVLRPRAVAGVGEHACTESAFHADFLRTSDLSARARVSLGLLDLTKGSPLSHWLLWVGHDDQKKGLPALLKALVLLPSSVGLMVVGRGALSASARALAQSYGVASRVAWLGPLSEVAPAYWACDVLVHPTLEDTFGMVVLEAMSWARPVVVSAPEFCGISSHLTHGQEAWVLPNPEDVAQLSQAIQALLDPAVGAPMAERAWSWSQAHDWESVCLAQEAVYRAVLESSQRAHPTGRAGHG